MDNDQYLDLMASQAVQGLLSSNVHGPWKEFAEAAHDIAEAMWEEREKRRAARAAYLGEKE